MEGLPGLKGKLLKKSMFWSINLMKFMFSSHIGERGPTGAQGDIGPVVKGKFLCEGSEFYE